MSLRHGGVPQAAVSRVFTDGASVSEETRVYEDVIRIVHPEDRAYVDRQWTAALAGEPFDIEYRMPEAGVFIGIACLWDIIDGAVARAEKKVTKFGYYLEGIIDKWVEIIIYVGFAASGYALESLLVVSATLMLSFAKPRAAMVVPIGEHDWPAIGERFDRLLLLNIGLAAFLIWPAVRIGHAVLPTLQRRHLGAHGLQQLHLLRLGGGKPLLALQLLELAVEGLELGLQELPAGRVSRDRELSGQVLLGAGELGEEDLLVLPLALRGDQPAELFADPREPPPLDPERARRFPLRHRQLLDVGQDVAAAGLDLRQRVLERLQRLAAHRQEHPDVGRRQRPAEDLSDLVVEGRHFLVYPVYPVLYVYFSLSKSVLVR